MKAATIFLLRTCVQTFAQISNVSTLSTNVFLWASGISLSVEDEHKMNMQNLLRVAMNFKRFVVAT